MDHLSRSLLNTFTAQPLDRVAHGRKDKDWLSAQASHRNARFLVLNKHNLMAYGQQPLILSLAQFQQLDVSEPTALLGVKDKGTEQESPVFKINVNDPDTALAPLLNNPEFADIDAFEAHPLRGFVHCLDVDTASMYSYASILNHWHQTTRFCTRCGSGLVQREGGVIQQCSNDDCRHIEFPRINSAVIMRVTHGEKILLARQETWPEGRYSVLAGFVEVGETLEHAVQREVMEEVNVPVESINYHSCQPWPFPNSLMLGYTAEASATEFELEQDDIAEAMWLTADELIEKMREGAVMPPPNLSISYRLINDWFAEKTGTQLSDYQHETPWQN